MNVVTRGVRNAFRNTIRTSSIVAILGLSIGLALAMLVARQAVGDKITSVKGSVGNTISISPAGARGFEGGGEALTADELAKVATLTHVTGVNETLNDRLSSDNTNLVSAVDAGSLGRRFFRNDTQGSTAPTNVAPQATTDQSAATPTFTMPVTVLGTTTPTDLTSTQGGGTFTLKSGAVFAGDSAENVAVIGTELATKNNLQVGSTFTAYGQTIKVVAIFDAGNKFANSQLLMPLKTLQTVSGQSGSITNATATVDSISNITSVTSAIQSTLGDKADVTNASEQAQQVVAPLENIKTISTYSLIGAIVAGAVIILLTMIMIVRERRREIGVIKAIGASNTTIVGQFVTEAVTLTGLGAIVGILFGTIAANPITKMLVNNSQNTATSSGPSVAGRAEGGMRAGRGAFNSIHDGVSNISASVGWDIILYGLIAALIIAAVGSIIASYFIAKVRPAEVMRAE